MVQNRCSIDFKRASKSGNSYSFVYRVDLALKVATAVNLQNYNGMQSLPAWYDDTLNRLYAAGVNGYWNVGLYSLEYVPGPNQSLDAIYKYLKNAVIDRRVTGNPVVVTDAYRGNVSELSVDIIPTQSGSGDPSPDNIRPVSGVSSVTVTRTDANGANSASVTVALVDSNNDPLTVYGGTLDITTGLLSVNYKKVDLSTFTWRQSGASATYDPGRTFFTISGMEDMWLNPVPNGALYEGYGVSNCLRQTTLADDTIPYTFSIWLNTIYNGYRLFVSAPNCADLTAFNNWIREIGAYLVYRIATPVPYQLTAAQLALLAGYNYIYSEAGPVTVRYTSDASLVLGGD